MIAYQWDSPDPSLLLTGSPVAAFWAEAVGAFLASLLAGFGGGCWDVTRRGRR